MNIFFFSPVKVVDAKWCSEESPFPPLDLGQYVCSIIMSQWNSLHLLQPIILSQNMLIQEETNSSVDLGMYIFIIMMITKHDAMVTEQF